MLSSMPSFARLLEDINQRDEVRTHMQHQQSKISSKHSEKGTEEELSSLLITDETKQSGSIQWKIYADYFRAGLGSLFVLFILVLLFVLQQFISKLSRRWLASWTDEESHRHENMNNCSSIISPSILHIRNMSTDEWNAYRNRRLQIYART